MRFNHLVEPQRYISWNVRARRLSPGPKTLTADCLIIWDRASLPQVVPAAGPARTGLADLAVSFCELTRLVLVLFPGLKYQ
jgi:hypothetical protein